MSQQSQAKMMNKLKFPMTVLMLALITYMYPRFLIQSFGADSPWTSFLYLYGHGFIFFSVGLWTILKTGACQLGRGYDTFWFKVLIFGFVFFATIHGTWVWLALSMPVKGGN